MENIRVRTNKNSTTYQVLVIVNGKQVSKSFSTKQYGSKKVTLERAKDFRNKLMAGEIQPKKKDTMDEIMEECLDTFSRSLETQKKWRSAYNKFIKKDFGTREIASITSIDIQKNLNGMVATSSNDTIGRVFTIWKQLFKTAIMKDVVQIDQTYKVEKPKSDIVSTPKKQTLDDDDFWELVETLLKGTADYKTLGYALQVIYYTGARPNEVYALTGEDVDRTNGLISINKSIGTSTTQKRAVKPTKNPNSIRTIPYNAKLDEIWDVLPKSGPLFLKENGEYMDGNYTSTIIKNLSGGKVHAYTLRHQFSTDLLNKGVDLRTIQELMGHTSSTMTLEYARSDIDKLRNAVTKKMTKLN